MPNGWEHVPQRISFKNPLIIRDPLRVLPAGEGVFPPSHQSPQRTWVTTLTVPRRAPPTATFGFPIVVCRRPRLSTCRCWPTTSSCDVQAISAREERMEGSPSGRVETARDQGQSERDANERWNDSSTKSPCESQSDATRQSCPSQGETSCPWERKVSGGWDDERCDAAVRESRFFEATEQLLLEYLAYQKTCARQMQEKEPSFPHSRNEYGRNQPTDSRCAVSKDESNQHQTRYTSISDSRKGRRASGMGCGASVPRRRRTRIGTKATLLLKHWVYQNYTHPYPSKEEKTVLMKQTNLNSTQLNTWFINTRARIRKETSQENG